MAWDYGSQHQLRRWILERPDAVVADLLKRNDALRGWASKIEWLSPRHDTNVELRDQAWTEIGSRGSVSGEAGGGPEAVPSGTPVARVYGRDGQVGGIFVEAKGARGVS